MKTYSMKASDYFEFINPNYIFLRVTPSNSLRNYNSDLFIPIISRLYLKIADRIKSVERKLFFESNAKMAYYIYMEKSDVQFYFVVPEKHYNLFKDKIIDVWSNKITITKEDRIPIFDMDCTKYYMTYKNADAMSLTCDKRNNTLLGSQLNTLHVMEEGDKVGVFYNFFPVWHKSWRATWDHAIEDMKNNIPTFHGRPSASVVGKLALKFIITVLDTALEAVNLGGASNKKTIRDLDLSKSTLNKRDNYIVGTQIVCLSQSEDASREKNNALVMCSSFECLNEDNILLHKKVKDKVKMNLLATKIKGVDIIKTQPKEAQNFISLPARELLEEFKAISHTNVLETEIPPLLRTGYISLGMSMCKGKETEAFLRDNYDQGSMPLIAVGEQGSGKTTFISNYCRNALSRNESIILIDFIKNCELADTVAKIVPKDKLIVVDMSDVRSVQGIGYNEVIPRSINPVDVLDVSNRKALYIQTLIDALNIDGDLLSSSMDRYLNAASNIVFLNHNASLKDVMRCLNDHEYRNHCISKIPAELEEYLTDEIVALKELDDYDGNGVVRGTKNIKIDGINHRINLLRKDLRLKMMFQKGVKDNVDLVKAMDEGKVVLFKMPQEYFATPYSKNVIVTYLFTKIWAATLVRGSKESKPKRCHVVVDEIFQSKTAMRLLKEQEIAPQTRKFGTKFVFSCQYLGQMGVINQTLRSAGASYMLMKGSGKANFNEFKDELAPFTLEDLEALPQYSSLNLINYEGGRAKFITRLPKPIK